MFSYLRIQPRKPHPVSVKMRGTICRHRRQIRLYSLKQKRQLRIGSCLFAKPTARIDLEFLGQTCVPEPAKVVVSAAWNAEGITQLKTILLRGILTENI